MKTEYNVLLEYAENGQNEAVSLRDIKPILVNEAQSEVQEWKPINGDRIRNQSSPFQVLDFFCGCGGMSLGFAALSRIIPLLEMVGGCDIDRDALATYERNFSVPGVNMDVRKLVDDDTPLYDLLNMLPNFNSKRRTIVIGCPPCQGFTSHRKRHWYKDDHRNTLVGAFVSVAVRLSPECIIMENVPEMLSKKYWSHFEEAQTILEEAGYQISQAIYNMASFGVPQDRFRALVIAMKKPFLLPELQILSPSRYETVRRAIGHLPCIAPGKPHPKDPLHRSAAHRESTLQTIKSIPKDGGSRPTGVGPKCLDRVRGFYDVYGRLAWERPAITITHYARNPASGRYVHPEQDRGLTMREAALLQSFPNGFEFHGSFDSVFKQIGEAVPPLFAAAVAVNCLIEVLSREPAFEETKKAVQPITNPVSSSYSSVIAGLKMARGGR